MEDFVAKQLELLEIERTSEVEENKLLQECSSVKDLQKKGICVTKLRLVNSSTGLFGRSLCTFDSFWPGSALSTHSMTSGDIVGIGVSSADGKREILASGVITRANEASITVAFDKDSNISELERDIQYMMIKLANDVTYRRIKRALKNLHQHRNGRNTQMIDVLFDACKPSSIDPSVLNSISFFNCNLNDTQKEAVKFMLLQKDVAILHGPPGTGKTTTVVECILQAVAQKLKVLACAPSNVAVDNLVEKLAQYKVKMIRLGHPARFLTGIQQYSLDAVISRSNGGEVIDDLHKEIDKLKTKINKAKGPVRKSLWGENKNLQKEVRQREKTVMQEVLKTADIVLATIASASDDGPIKHLPKDHFNVCFIDECSQALEAACWIPLLLVPKCVLAGDHKQLPPTIISKKAAEDGLSLTLMERILKVHGESIKMMLTMQYRMHEDIMQWPSQQLYDRKLEAHVSVRMHLLKDLPCVKDNEDTEIPLLLIDTSGCHLDELDIEDEESKGNEGEADLVVHHVENLIKSGIGAADIAVITPYNLQVDLIKTRFSGKYPRLEIKSVDGFQGREKEAVVISLVRSNSKGEVGFLSEDRRINVAITRARRHLTVICNSETVSHHDFLKSFIDYCSEKGEVRTALQYGENIGQPSIVRARPTSTKGNLKLEEKKRDKTQKKSTVDSREKAKTGVEPKEDRLVVIEKYKQIIQKFQDSKDTLLIFPPSLNPFERRTVHEISEEMKLTHVSSGEGLERFIKISKFALLPEPTNKLQLETDNKEVKEPIVNVCNGFESLNVEENIPIASVEVSFHEHKAKAIPKQKPQNPQPKQKDPPVKLKSEKPKVKTLNLKGEGDEDFDSLIQQVMKADRTCSYQTCKKSVATLSQDCQYCNRRFCFSHFIAEAHGCGNAAKIQARSRIRKEGQIYPGSGKPQKKVDSITQAYLQKKLDQKIDDMSKQRKTKSKEK